MKRYVLFFLLFALLLLPVFIAQPQEGEENPILSLTVGSESCELVLQSEASEAEATAEASEAPEDSEEAEATPEATEEALEMIVLTVSADCNPNAFRLASNGTLWIALSVDGEEDWQEFAALEEDESAPSFDRRGRFVGCRNPNEGEQLCRLVWEFEGVRYLIEIPIFVGDAFTAGVPISVQQNSSSSETAGTGEWGACGSCSSCDGASDVCVTSPEGLCVADPARCAAPPPQAPAPQTTEQP
jgi:hypothetical protein